MFRRRAGKKFVEWGMAVKRRKNGIGDADDMENEICYSDTVYKWVLSNLLFYFQGRDLIL